MQEETAALGNFDWTRQFRVMTPFSRSPRHARCAPDTRRESGHSSRQPSADCVAKLFAALRERNYRIRPNSTLNRYCPRALILESILLNLAVKIVLQHILNDSGR